MCVGMRPVVMSVGSGGKGVVVMVVVVLMLVLVLVPVVVPVVVVLRCGYTCRGVQLERAVQGA